jgi:hypothetical protein
MLIRVSGVAARRRSADDQTLLAAWRDDEGPHVLWLGLVGSPPRLTVRLVPLPGAGPQTWRGPTLWPGRTFDVEIALFGAMGPGGVLWRLAEAGNAPWSSLLTSSPHGPAQAPRPTRWASGHGQSGPADRPFRGERLRVLWQPLRPGD